MDELEMSEVEEEKKYIPRLYIYKKKSLRALV